MKKCPFCKEEIQDLAKKCRHCGEWIEQQGFEVKETENKSTTLPDETNNEIDYSKLKRKWLAFIFWPIGILVLIGFLIVWTKDIIGTNVAVIVLLTYFLWMVISIFYWMYILGKARKPVQEWSKSSWWNYWYVVVIVLIVIWNQMTRLEKEDAKKVVSAVTSEEYVDENWNFNKDLGSCLGNRNHYPVSAWLNTAK